MASELLSDQKRVSRTGVSPSELLILCCSMFLESKLMVSHPKVRLGLSDWKSWSAKPRFELVTPGADMAQAWGSCRDIGGSCRDIGVCGIAAEPPFSHRPPHWHTFPRPLRGSSGPSDPVLCFPLCSALHEQLRGCCVLHLIS